MTALPPLASIACNFESHHIISNAYELCLQTERSLLAEQQSSQLVYARILGYLILHAPSKIAQECVAHDIITCACQPDLLELGETYMNQFILPFKKFSRSTPAESRDTPSPLFDDFDEVIKTKLVKDPQNYKEAKASALIRDNFRCMVTKKFDKDSAMENAELRRSCLADIAAGGPSAEMTQCCHIFPESTNVGLLPSSLNTPYAAITWTLLERFGYAHILQEIKLIHRLENIMTLSVSVRDSFDSLELWFEATDELNRYTVKAWNDALLILLNIPTSVKFVSTDETLPLPSPQYLSLHAACAKVARFSGAAEYIESLHEDTENVDVLSVNGSSGDLLDYALVSAGAAA